MKRRLLLLSAALILILLAVAAYEFLPYGHAPAKQYFAPIGERKLQTDEIGQFNFVFETYEHMSFTGDEFRGWDIHEQLLWRYGIAFGAYAMPSIAMISPEHADRAKLCLKHMIEKMKSKKGVGRLDCIRHGR
ncbi:MAG: hypothetical protein AAF587_41620 [Bacteroidota bacterium]